MNKIICGYLAEYVDAVIKAFPSTRLLPLSATIMPHLANNSHQKPHNGCSYMFMYNTKDTGESGT